MTFGTKVALSSNRAQALEGGFSCRRSPTLDDCVAFADMPRAGGWTRLPSVPTLPATMRLLRSRSPYCVDEPLFEPLFDAVLLVPDDDELPSVELEPVDELPDMLEPVFAEAVRSFVALEPVVDDPAGCEMPSAATVCESSRPVACRPFAFWNLRMAACVCGPILPSTEPALKPCEFSAS